MSLVRNRAMTEKEEFERLAPFAARSAESRGRIFDEPEHPYRSIYQRDRDRVVHSTAFRRLEYKTQVFVFHEGDHYRNRLTHTLEASQIVRTVARALRLNEELAEAIVLAHDLGHTPFGHAGERVLAKLMREHGGFDHNRQSLRIVDLLEERDPRFRGLNLSYETREGILKHGCHWDHPLAVPEPSRQPSLEAQVADLSDEIAYTNHDLDDGLRSGLLQWDELAEVEIWRDVERAVRSEFESIPDRVVRPRLIASLINHLVTELIQATAARIESSGVDSLDAVRQCDIRLAALSPEVEKQKLELKGFLHRNFYDHPQVAEVSERAAGILDDIFAAYRADPELLPAPVRERFSLDGAIRVIADYIAGMTDRFAIEEHRRLGDNCGVA